MTILMVMVVVGLVATVIALFTGIVSMAHGGSFDQHHSHQLMFSRVGFQGITLVLLLIALLLSVR
jgi:FlaG/FlaF family flagellin (archaellin)